ncbi:MAG: hypothetical protein KKF33_20070 [Alphaproteobacteria bacterium]|nr:hypothetical protein [Alphaproteobacteria bacterium]
MLTVEKPKTSTTTLIVLLAFVRDEEGELQVAFEPREVQSEDKAKMDARRMAALGTYAGVIAWSRSADLVNGEFGAPVVIFQHGDVPEME